MNITILVTRDLEGGLEPLCGFLREKIADYFKQDMKLFSLKIMPAEKTITERGKQAQYELEKGNILVTSLPTGEALRRLKSLGCQDLINTYKIFIVGGQPGTYMLKVATCERETVLCLPKSKEEKRRTHEPRKQLLALQACEQTFRPPHKDD